VFKLLSHLPKSTEFTYAFKCYQNNVTSKNVSWPHFSWATLYMSDDKKRLRHTVRRNLSKLKTVVCRWRL